MLTMVTYPRSSELWDTTNDIIRLHGKVQYNIMYEYILRIRQF